MNHEVLPLLGQVADSVSRAIAHARPELAGADPLVRRSEHADFQSNAALSLATRARLKPAELADALTAALGADDRGPITHVEVSGPGFLNITVPDQLVWHQLAARLASPHHRASTSRTRVGPELDAYSTALTEVNDTLEPHKLCGYLYDLARDFTTFYEACHVLRAEEPARTKPPRPLLAHRTHTPPRAQPARNQRPRTHVTARNNDVQTP